MRLISAFLAFLAVGCATGPARPTLPALYPGDAGFKISGDIVDQSEGLVKYVRARERAGGALLIEIDSLGGLASEGLSMYRIIKAASVPSVCLVNGKGASAAFLVLQACTRRIMTHDSTLATHRPFTTFPMPTSITVEAAEELARRLGRLARLWDSLIAERLGMTGPDYLRKVADGEVWVMDADAAIEANAVDLVVDGSPMPDLSPKAPNLGP